MSRNPGGPMKNRFKFTPIQDALGSLMMVITQSSCFPRPGDWQLSVPQVIAARASGQKAGRLVSAGETSKGEQSTVQPEGEGPAKSVLSMTRPDPSSHATSPSWRLP